MADERVVIKIEVKSDDRAIDRTRRKLERLAGARDRDRKSEGLASRSRSTKLTKELNGNKDLFNRVSRKYDKRFDSFDKMIKNTGMGMMKFLSLSAKAVTVSMAAMGAAMMGIHVAFAAGQLIMKAYSGVMKMAAAGMAGLVIVAGTVAAALREQQAAMYAFSGKGQAKEFGSALNQTRVQMRALTMDASLASIGVDNLTAAYAAVVKTGGQFTAASKASLKGLMDFASAGMDMKEGTKQAGALIATLQDTKKSYGEVVSAGKKFSPQLKKALEEYEKGKGEKTKAGLSAAIKSGELAKLGGVEGQFGAVSGTLINTLKGELNMLKGFFADFGQGFLAPMKKEGKEVFAIITLALQRISGQVTEFGQGGFIDKISVVVDKIANFVVRTMRDFLPGSMGMFERIGAWWDRFTSGWNRILDVLRPFIEGAKVFESILKNAWLPVWEQIQENMYSFNNQLMANRPQIEEFGTNIGELLRKVMEYFGEARKLFFQALPFINKVVKGFTSLIELFTSFLGGFTKLTGGMGGMGGMSALMGLISMSRGMKNTKGYFTQKQSSSGIREVANMNVRSGVVYVNGKPVAQYGPSGRGGSSGIVERSNSIRTGPSYMPRGGPFRGSPGTGTGPGDSGFASTGGKGTARGPNDSYLIRSGKYAGHEILRQRVGGQSVNYAYKQGSGQIDQARLRATGVQYRSGVFVPENQRVDARGRKRFSAHGRIMNRRERMWRGFGEGQKLGAGGYTKDGRVKTYFDRTFARANNGLDGRLGRFADKMRDKQIARSKYLGPGAIPAPPPPSAGPKAYAQWKLNTVRAYDPGLRDPYKRNADGSAKTRADGSYKQTMRAKYQNSALYNNWMSPTSDITGKGPKQLGTGWKSAPFRGIQNARLGAGNARKSRLGGMILGNDKRKGLQGSAMGGMGVGMGLGMLASSGMVSEEAQGFLSAGAMVGMMNPLAGLAIGLGGTALTAKTVGGGAVAGAGAGAAIGSMIAPGFGTAAGAIIGAAVGGLMGGLNKVKDEKKKARKAFESVFENIFATSLGQVQQKMLASGGVGKSEILKAARAGGAMDQGQKEILDMFRSGASSKDLVAMLKKNKGKYGLDDTEIAEMEKRPEESMKVIDKMGVQQKAQNHLSDIYAKRLDALSKIMGKSEQEVETLAMSMGVDLFDATKDFNEQVKQLGATTVKTREQLRGLQMDLALKGLDKFTKGLENLDAPKILDEQSRAFRDMADAADGAITDTEFSEFIQQFVPNMLNFAGGGLQGLIEQKALFGKGGTEFSRSQGIKGVTSGPNKFITSPFYGMEDQFTTSAAGVAYQQYVNDGIKQGVGVAGGQLNAELFASTSADRFIMDTNKFTEQFQLLNPAMQKQFLNDLENNQLFAGQDMAKFTQSDFQSILAGYGLDANRLGMRNVEADDGLNIALDKMPEALRDTYAAVIELFGNFFKERDKDRPEWFSKAAFDALIKGADTHSPRGKGVGDTTSSRLGQTMGRHSAMDSMLTGKRTVSSSYRTTGLGSMNSDHITGRAYDLVGQNLGAYQRLATTNGGFAEFHGSNASRHLHVVPRLGAYGDTGSVSSKITTAPSMSSASSKGDSGITISQVIYGSANASPDQIAEAAIRKMKLALENERQRR